MFKTEATAESIIIENSDREDRASLSMGIHEFDQEDQKLKFHDGSTLSTKLSDPQAVLSDIEQVRDTFLTSASPNTI